MSNIYQFKIELVGSHNKIWRRIQVPGDLAFDQFHDIIKISMGWQGDHPYEFFIDETRVYDFEAVIDMGDHPEETDAMENLIEELVTVVETEFTYNFSDRWEHRIILEKILPSKEEATRAVCIGGEGACPPADCGGILHYHDMLNILADENHPEHNNIKKQIGQLADIGFFSIKKTNARLGRYAKEWEEIYDETGKTIARLEGKHLGYDPENDGDFDDFDDPDEEDSEYNSLKHLTSPWDLLDDELQRLEMEGCIEDELRDNNSVESEALGRLFDQGHKEKKGMAMILEVLAIEWFYEIKYDIDHLDSRYEYNLRRLPERPREIPSLECAVQVLDSCRKGIPFAAIEYLHNDTSPEATSAVIKALENFSDHRYCWEDCTSTPIWYSLAAEGHLCEELIDPVIAFYGRNNVNESDWLNEQGEYLIGKLAQKYPDTATQKVLAAMEKDADEDNFNRVFFLFDVFYFCDIDRYKDRLIALLKRDEISWHDCLASTIGYLQIKEGLPVLKEQLKRLEAEKPEKGTWDYNRQVEIEEAIEQLETGRDLYPDVDMPICLRRGTTWKEEFADAEEYFYAPAEDDFNLGDPGFFEPGPSPERRPAIQQTVINENKIGRNDFCPCGSGKKYKKCCLDKDQEEF